MRFIRRLSAGTNELSFNSVRGFYYKVPSTTDLGTTFTDEPGRPILALDNPVARTNAATGPRKFYRVSSSVSP
jgi:hypothetical protein